MPEGARVIGGTARGVRLEVPTGGTRPLSDRVKESLFASLEAEGALDGPFLDLFAGSGAGGIEALSRGAPSATFVERDTMAARVIDANLARAGVRGRIVRGDVLRFLGPGRPEADEQVAAVLIDPPYDQPLVEPTLELLGDAALAWLAPGAVVVAKHFWRQAPGETFGVLSRERQKRFGETVLSFYTRE